MLFIGMSALYTLQNKSIFFFRRKLSKYQYISTEYLVPSFFAKNCTIVFYGNKLKETPFLLKCIKTGYCLMQYTSIVKCSYRSYLQYYCAAFSKHMLKNTQNLMCIHM